MSGNARAAPVLETARLVLRPYQASDLEAQAAAMGDPEVVRHLGATPFSREDTWRRLLCAPGLWSLLGYGYWAIVARDDGRYLGQLGFADFKRDMTPRIEGLPEIGWIFAPAAQGQGYATEAAQAALAWADAVLDAPEIVAIIDADNLASIRVAQKCGFNENEPATYRGEPIILFRRKRA
ncbi:MAG TPA: GNAT family N-acetyltransferase [Allosphingosinicella sp.]|nr:GNAT family N-acetyltransferase [Allosphingosinicella sp.]